MQNDQNKIEDEIARMYKVANDYEADLLDELRERAGILWVCRCLWRNHESEARCGGCGSGKRPERNADGTFPRVTED